MTTPDVTLISLKKLPSVGTSSTTAGRKKLLHLVAGTVKGVTSKSFSIYSLFVIFDDILQYIIFIRHF
jgi:hypothetical protein